MVKNYLQVVFRAIAHNKIYSAINIVGLTIGLCAGLIVTTVVIDDLSYDRQWKHSEDLYRTTTIEKMGEGMFEKSGSAFAGTGNELKKNFPEVQAVSAIHRSSLRLRLDAETVNVSDASEGVELAAMQADTGVWNLLDIPVISGNPRQFVAGKNNLLVSAHVRDRFFAGRDPVGQTVYQVSGMGEKPVPFLITGVMQDLPSNTHLRADVIRLTAPLTEALYHAPNGTYTTQYVLLRHGTDIAAFTKKVNQWHDAYMGKANRSQLVFQPMKDIFLHSDFDHGQSVKGSLKNIYIFSGVAFLLFLIACINYLNLSTARVVARIHETGIRKVLGAGRRDIILRSLAESVVFFMGSMGLALLFYQASLPLVVRFLGHPLSQTFLSSISLLAPAVCAILLFSLLAGFYPACLLSGIPAAGALRGSLFGMTSQGPSRIRQGLVVLQFSISVLVLLGMIVVQSQVHFMENADIGYEKKDLLSIGFVSWEGRGDVFKNELKKIPGVIQSSICSFEPSVSPFFMSRKQDDPLHPGSKITVSYLSGDIDFVRTLGLHAQSGRLFNPALGTDAWVNDFSEKMKGEPSLMTSSTAAMLHIRNLQELPADMFSRPVGIVNDFHNQSLRESISPTLILAEPSPDYGAMLVRVRPGSEVEVMTGLRRIWKQLYPTKLLEARWTVDLLKQEYAEEHGLEQLLLFFSLLTMVLAALGIFGLIVHAAGQRVREIGVRRVLGASAGSIVRLLSSDFARLVLLAIVIASPVSWWLMHTWLESFAYRISIQVWMFGLAAAVTMAIALLTVSIQAIKSAFANPIESLRSE